MSIATVAETSGGTGVLRFAVVGGETAIVESKAASPLKLLCLRRPTGAAWAYASTYGGGLLAGDHIRLSMTLDAGARCFLGTQASTKIYRSRDGRESRQTLDAALGPGSVCVAMPDPITCFSDARFSQRQRWDLDASASLVLVDWLTSGRHAAGERWAMQRYDSRIDVQVAGKLRVRETLLLDSTDGPIGSASRMGRFDCFATMLIVGPRVREIGEGIVRFVASARLGEAGALFAASPLEGGAIVRVAGKSAEAVGAWMRDRLSPVSAILGEAPWERKR